MLKDLMHFSLKIYLFYHLISDPCDRSIGHELSCTYSSVRINYGHLVPTRCNMEDCIV